MDCPAPPLITARFLLRSSGCTCRHVQPDPLGSSRVSRGSILVVGGGIAGLTAALEAADTGYETFLVEKSPYLGGRVAQMNKYFPKLCPPYCGLEVNFKRLRGNGRVQFFTLAEVVKVSGHPGDFEVTVRLNPRYVVPRKCTACGECVAVCPAERPNEFNYGMGKTKAIYLPHEMAMPPEYVIDIQRCLGKECARCVEACKYDAIDLEMQPSIVNLKVAAICLATGWRPYDATRIAHLGFGSYDNVITNVMMERLAAPNGPTQGSIVRPTDGKGPESVAFVQCAGSRDENHLSYCSAVCCMASLKQVTYVREQHPNANVYIFYIDIRAPGTYEDFYSKLQKDDHVTFIKGKVAKIEEDPQSRDLIVDAESVMTGEKIRVKVGMVVLATGMVPVAQEHFSPGVELTYDAYGFLTSNTDRGIYAAGVAKMPLDVTSSVRSAMGAALKSIQCIARSQASDG